MSATPYRSLMLATVTVYDSIRKVRTVRTNVINRSVGLQKATILKLVSLYVNIFADEGNVFTFVA